MSIRLWWYLLLISPWVGASSIAEARTVIYSFEPIPQLQYKGCFPRPIAVLTDGTVLFWGPGCPTTMIYKWSQNGLEIFYDGSAAFSDMHLTLQEHGWIYFTATMKTPPPAGKLLRFSEDDASGKPVDVFLGTNIKGGYLLPGASEHGGVVVELDGSRHRLKDGVVTDISTSVPPAGLDYQNFVWTEAGSPSGRIARVVAKLNAPGPPYPPVWTKIYIVPFGGPDSLEELKKDPGDADRYQLIGGYTNEPGGLRAPTFQDEGLLWSSARYTPATPNSVVT